MMHVQQLQQEPGVMDAHLRVVGWKTAMGRSLKDVRVTISKQAGCELSAMRKEAPPKDAQASRSVRSVYFLRFDVPAASVSNTHFRAHETVLDLVCRLLLEKKNQDS